MNKHSVALAMLCAFTMGAACPPADANVATGFRFDAPPPVPLKKGPPPPQPKTKKKTAPPTPTQLWNHRRVYFDKRPDFIWTPRLGFSVSIGGAFDLILFGDRYYVCDDKSWYWSRAYDGPWFYIESNRLPEKLRRYRQEEIRQLRDEEYQRRQPDYSDKRFDRFRRFDRFNHFRRTEQTAPEDDPDRRP